MDAYIYDTNFNAIKIIDDYVSFIWTERYNKAGDFELYLPFYVGVLAYIQEGYYVGIHDSDRLMIIESLVLNTDVDSGSYLTVTGRSLESILDRRIIWEQTNLDSKLQTGIKKLMNENVISPSDSARQISNVIFQDTDDPVIDDYEIRAQYTGDNLYDSLVEITEAYQIGFKMVKDDSNQFIFSLYNGADRSFNQEANPYIIFSPKYENLFSSNYQETSENLKNVALVAGEGEGAERRTSTVSLSDENTGLLRREMYVDARDISSTVDEGEEPMTDEEYTEKLDQRGIENLAEHTYTSQFEGEVDTSTTMFKYGQDFFMGDIVQIRNEYGMEAVARISEFIRSCDSSGYNEYPTFELL